MLAALSSAAVALGDGVASNYTMPEYSFPYASPTETEVGDADIADPSVQVVKSFWTVEEDELLRQHVELVGPRRWTKQFDELIPGRNGKQCRARWTNHLSASVVKDKWTEEEDHIIMTLVDQWGTKWSKIAHALPHGSGRTDNAIKNRWNSLMRKQLRGAFRKIKKANPELNVACPGMAQAMVGMLDGDCAANVEPASVAAGLALCATAAPMSVESVEPSSVAASRQPGKSTPQATALASLCHKEIAARSARDLARSKRDEDEAENGDHKRRGGSLPGAKRARRGPTPDEQVVVLDAVVVNTTSTGS